MANPKITAADMIAAIKGMNRQEKRAFSKALSDADIDLGEAHLVAKV